MSLHTELVNALIGRSEVPRVLAIDHVAGDYVIAGVKVATESGFRAGDLREVHDRAARILLERNHRPDTYAITFDPHGAPVLIVPAETPVSDYDRDLALAAFGEIPERFWDEPEND